MRRHGSASGIDSIANKWAIYSGVAVLAFSADWERYGRRARPMRDARMLTDGKPDIVVAFPGDRWTADMVRQAKRAGVRVIEVGKESSNG